MCVCVCGERGRKRRGSTRACLLHVILTFQSILTTSLPLAPLSSHIPVCCCTAYSDSWVQPSTRISQHQSASPPTFWPAIQRPFASSLLSRATRYSSYHSLLTSILLLLDNTPFPPVPEARVFSLTTLPPPPQRPCSPCLSASLPCSVVGSST